MVRRGFRNPPKFVPGERERERERERGQTHHAPNVVKVSNAARVHQPVIGVTNALDREAVGLGPGC